MREKNKKLESGRDVFIGIDLHKRTWHVTVRTKEVELFSGSIPGCWEALRPVVDRYKGNRIQAVYEAGYFGFWLYDRLKEHGVECIVTPPVYCLRNMVTE